jgi:hypothetical protein
MAYESGVLGRKLEGNLPHAGSRGNIRVKDELKWSKESARKNETPK